MTEQTNPGQDEQVGAIENLDQFAFLISSWHGQNMRQLNHMTTVPSGQSVTLQLSPDDVPEDVSLEGDLLKGFKAGIIVAMNIFAELPFGAVPTPETGDDTPASGE